MWHRGRLGRSAREAGRQAAGHCVHTFAGPRPALHRQAEKPLANERQRRPQCTNYGAMPRAHLISPISTVGTFLASSTRLSSTSAAACSTKRAWRGLGGPAVWWPAACWTARHATLACCSASERQLGRQQPVSTATRPPLWCPAGPAPAQRRHSPPHAADRPAEQAVERAEESGGRQWQPEG